MKAFRILALVVVTALVVSACAKAPEAKIQQARDALQTARDAGAPTYAGESWKAAEAAGQALETELQAQNKKAGLFRSYRKVASLADGLAKAAEEAQSQAAQKTAGLRSELSGTIAELKGLMQTARNRLAAIPGTVRVDAAALRAKLAAAGERIDQSQRELDGGQFDRAMAGTGEAREGIRAVLRTIDSVTPRTSSKKR